MVSSRQRRRDPVAAAAAGRLQVRCLPVKAFVSVGNVFLPLSAGALLAATGLTRLQADN